MSDLTKTKQKAEVFRSLHQAGSKGLLLPNAWDAASARIFEETGFPAIGTTSASRMRVVCGMANGSDATQWWSRSPTSFAP